MGIENNIPQIAALRQRVEQRFGNPLDVHSDFLQLVAEIEKELREHISESTLERVWGYSTRGYNSVSLRTLNVLAKYIQFALLPSIWALARPFLERLIHGFLWFI